LNLIIIDLKVKLDALAKLPLVLGTPSLKQRKADLEMQAKGIEDSLEVLEKPARIWVRAEDLEDAEEDNKVEQVAQEYSAKSLERPSDMATLPVSPLVEDMREPPVQDDRHLNLSDIKSQRGAQRGLAGDSVDQLQRQIMANLEIKDAPMSRTRHTNRYNSSSDIYSIMHTETQSASTPPALQNPQARKGGMVAVAPEDPPNVVASKLRTARTSSYGVRQGMSFD
jgi:hypothetical protein